MKKSAAGFTLLEVLVSMGIVALISTLVAQAFFSTTRTNTKAELLKDVKQNGDFVLEVLSRMIRNSRAITSSCVGTSNIFLTMVNPDGGSTTLGCMVDGSVIRIASQSGTGKIEYLTSNNLTLATCTTADISFTCSGLSSGTPIVNIMFRLARYGISVDQFEQASGSFEGSVVPRNTQ